MMQSTQRGSASWSLLQKITFRFFFIYILLQITPWTWLDYTTWTWQGNSIPGIGYVTDYYQRAIDRVVDLFNKYWFHFEKTTIINNGSGDTSLHWEGAFAFLSLAVIGSGVWSLLDRKRKSYMQANYWLRTFLRYYIIIMCFNYGINKLYAFQMSFPNQSQLATPLGDFLPMRLSWLFIGYSTPYQVFAGVMEILAGLLLLNRKTITLGLFVGTAVFMNVMAFNLCYDIPVKIFSIHLVIYCSYLLLNDCKRIIDFFLLNRPVIANTINHISFPKRWMRITRLVLKLAFIVLFVVMPFYTIYGFFRSISKPIVTSPIKSGLYDVTVFAVNKDTIPGLVTDTLRWKDVVFEKGGSGSVGSTDTVFRQRYRRGYFNFVPDTTYKTIGFKKIFSDTQFIFSLHYDLPDSNTIKLWGSRKTDSLYVVLKKSKRHFQLAERQFHWISEANR